MGQIIFFGGIFLKTRSNYHAWTRKTFKIGLITDKISQKTKDLEKFGRLISELSQQLIRVIELTPFPGKVLT